MWRAGAVLAFSGRPFLSKWIIMNTLNGTQDWHNRNRTAGGKYPKAKYHKTLGTRIVSDEAQEADLGDGWMNHPSEEPKAAPPKASKKPKPEEPKAAPPK